MTKKSRGTHLRRLTVCALFAALISALSPVAIPIGAIPLSLGLCGVLLTALTLPPAMSATAVAVYLTLGACGLPIFAAGGASAAALVSPTGGFLWSYLLAAPLVSSLAMRARRFGALFASALAALPICYLIGTLWYAFVTQTHPLAALTVTVLPFLPFDLCKALAAAWVGGRLRTLLRSCLDN